MGPQAEDRTAGKAPRPGRTVLWRAAEVAPWIVFGPITGILSGLALRRLRNNQPGWAAMYLVANLLILASIPLLTALIAARA
jgi:hypothetical protein